MSLIGLLADVSRDPALHSAIETARGGHDPHLDLVAPAALRPFMVGALAADAPVGAERPVLAITATEREAADLTDALGSLLPADSVALFPAWEKEGLEKAFSEHPTFARADDLDELAALTGVDPQGLRTTVEEYNAAVATGTDPWGRTHLPAPIDRAPFYAVRNHGTALKSPAGLAVDGRLRVLGGDDRPFTNLYAVGEALGGSSMSGRSFVSGMSVTPALSFGRLIGRAVAGADHHRRT